MVEMIVARLGLDSSSGSYVLVLRERAGERVLPIWIGQPEAESIVMQMHNLKRSRPLTHDLCKNIIVGLGATMRRVQVTRVEKNTYYAELHLARDGAAIRIDSRPSDGIAIALRFGAPIFASEELLTTLDVAEEAEESAPELPESRGTELTPEQLKEYLERLRPEDFGKFNP